jgi:hypothetical protein
MFRISNFQYTSSIARLGNLQDKKEDFFEVEHVE